MGTLRLDQGNGTLRIRTSVEGRASRMGHRLTIDVSDWSAIVELIGLVPQSVHLTADLTSLQVVSGDGGVTPLSPVDRAAIRRNALKSVHADDHPEVDYKAANCTATDEGFELSGELTINATTRAQVLTVTVTETETEWKLNAACPVTQTEFSIKPYSLMVGSLRVGDEVSVEFHATVKRDSIDH